MKSGLGIAAGLIASHTSFFYMGKRNTTSLDNKQNIINDTKNRLTISFPVAAVAALFNVAANVAVETPLIIPLILCPVISHSLFYEFGKYQAASENEELKSQVHRPTV